MQIFDKGTSILLPTTALAQSTPEIEGLVRDFGDIRTALPKVGFGKLLEAHELRSRMRDIKTNMPELDQLRALAPHGMVGRDELGLKLSPECFGGNSLFITTQGINYGREIYSGDSLVGSDGKDILSLRIPLRQALAWIESGVTIESLKDEIRTNIKDFVASNSPVAVA